MEQKKIEIKNYIASIENYIAAQKITLILIYSLVIFITCRAFHEAQFDSH